MKNNLTTLFATSVLLIGLSGCVVGNQVGHSGQDVYSTFGNITVMDGERAGNLENNSGNVTVGRNAKVKSVDITNGNIEIGDFSAAYSLTTVNGNIEIGQNAVITGNIETTNGQIKIEQGVNVSGNLLGSNGDIIVAANSIIKGDIIFEKTGLSSLADEEPTLSITGDANVDGKIHLYRVVNVILPESMSRDKVVIHYQGNK